MDQTEYRAPIKYETVQIRDVTLTLAGPSPEADRRREQIQAMPNLGNVPLMYDILASTAAIDGDPDHPLLRHFIESPRTWLGWFCNAPVPDYFRYSRKALRLVRSLNYHWYLPSDYSGPDSDLIDKLVAIAESGGTVETIPGNYSFDDDNTDDDDEDF